MGLSKPNKVFIDEDVVRTVLKRKNYRPVDMILFQTKSMHKDHTRKDIMDAVEEFLGKSYHKNPYNWDSNRFPLLGGSLSYEDELVGLNSPRLRLDPNEKKDIVLDLRTIHRLSLAKYRRYSFEELRRHEPSLEEI